MSKFKRAPKSVCIVVYDVQGDPVSDNIMDSISQAVEDVVDETGVASLAINVTKE